MRDHLLPHPLRLPSMGSHPCLPRPWVCGPLELTACGIKDGVYSTWILRSRGFFCRFPRPLLPSFSRQVEGTCSSLFCLFATISLRIPWVGLLQSGEVVQRDQGNSPPCLPQDDSVPCPRYAQ